jgi:hypothetical protein
MKCIEMCFLLSCFDAKNSRGVLFDMQRWEGPAI